MKFKYLIFIDYNIDTYIYFMFVNGLLYMNIKINLLVINLRLEDTYAARHMEIRPPFHVGSIGRSLHATFFWPFYF